MSSKSDFWLARTYYCTSTAVTCWIALADSTSRHSFVFSSDGVGGTIAVAVLLFLSILGIWDVVLDQWIRYESREYSRLKRYRFLMYWAMACGHASLLYAAIMRGITEAFLWRYVIDIAVGLTIMCLLVKRRHTAYVTTFR